MIRKYIFRLFSILIIVINANFIYAQENSSFIDRRDGTEYKTIKIGNQIWMAENLAS